MLDLEQIAREHLGAESLISVESNYSKNTDGEAVIWIEVVLKNGVSIDGSEMASLTDKIWSAVKASERDDFPVLSYISQQDFEDGKAA